LKIYHSSTKVTDLFWLKRLDFGGCAIDFACLPQSDKAVRLPIYMRQLAFFFFFLAASTLCAHARPHEIEFDQAREVALLVARYDHITVDDRTIVMNSMDTRSEAGFIPGYYSFSIIRESDSPAKPDETIRMYVVSKRTADTWELNLCTHYSFPELHKFQQDVMHKTGASSEDEQNMPKAIGCANQAQMKPAAE
jgi:hypothetical protein